MAVAVPVELHIYEQLDHINLQFWELQQLLLVHIVILVPSYHHVLLILHYSECRKQVHKDSYLESFFQHEYNFPISMNLFLVPLRFETFFVTLQKKSHLKHEEVRLPLLLFFFFYLCSKNI